MDISQQLTAISDKIYRVEEKLNKLNRENELLRTENEQLQAVLARQTDELKALYQKLDSTPPGQGETTNVSLLPAHDIHQQIDHYLGEINKCIEWLEQR